MCEALEAKDLEENASYRTGRDRAAHKDELLRDINAVTERFTTDELVERLNAAGVPCGPINDIGQAFEDPQVRHLKMAKMAPHATLGDVGLIRSPINLSRFPQSETFDRAAPDPGEDSEAILRDAGYSPERIAEFKAAGVI
jgi:crotonobetainyl-CoA:carnitine CoA-transferase CaiB-like acyl-CoA transferase